MAKKFDSDQFANELSERLKEMSRKPNIKKYKPHAKQYTFHSDPRKKKLYIGGNRSGKTTGGVCEGIWRATARHPYRPELNVKGVTHGRVVAVDFVNGVEKIIFPQYKQWLYPSALRGGSWENAYDKFSKTLNFSNGSTIEFMSYDQDLDKFAGTSRDWVHFDEEPPQSIYIENMARLIDTDGEFWITMTPVDGMTWIYEDLYEDNVGKEDGKVSIVEINTLENPYLSSGAIESFMESIDEDETTARIAGEFVQQGGRIYKKFDPTRGAVQVLKEEIDNPSVMFKDWLWVCALDHGLNNPTAILWTAFDKNGFGVQFDEHYQREWTVDQHAAEYHRRAKLHGRYPDLNIGDPSIVNRNGITNTSVQEEYQKYGIGWVAGNNDVSAGIIRVKRYFNLARYVGRRTHELFADELGHGEKKDLFPRLRIAPNCVNTIAEHKRYRWATFSNKKMTYDNNVKEVPHKKDDHTCDALRYLIMSQPDLAAENHNLGEKLSDMMQQFDFNVATQMDMTSDPNDLLGVGSNWREGNSMPNSDINAGWDFDEHMGGLY